MLDLRASGDGSYMHKGGYFFATGGVGLAVTAVAAVGRAAGNSARRKNAAAATVPQWTPIDNGQLYVAPSSFTMHAPGGVNNWYYTSLDTAQMVGPRQMHFQGSSTGGPISWILVSDWAELVFVTWALQQHPRHPQMLNGGWLPPGWLQRCRQHQHNTRLATPQLA